MRNHHPTQSGISLFLSLIALVIMSLAATALIRSVDTGMLAIGNIGYKQAATIASDRQAETAITWLTTNNTGTTLEENIPASGYYASFLNQLDITGNSTSSSRILIDWDGNSCANYSGYASCLSASSSSSANGLTSRYVITRLCRTAGNQNTGGNSCSQAAHISTTASNKRGEVKYGEDKRFSGNSGPYFRVIVRTTGPRNTVSFTETIVHF